MKSGKKGKEINAVCWQQSSLMNVEMEIDSTGESDTSVGGLQEIDRQGIIEHYTAIMLQKLVWGHFRRSQRSLAPCSLLDHLRANRTYTRCLEVAAI